MATDNYNIGAGIGAQGRQTNAWPMFAQTMARLDKRKADADEARRKAQEKDDEEFKKLINDKDIHTDGYHPMYSGAVKFAVKDKMNKMYEYKRDNPNDWYTGTKQLQQDLISELDFLKKNSDNVIRYEDDVAKGNIYASGDFLAKANSSEFGKNVYRDSSGKVVDPEWQNIPADPLVGVSFNPNAGSFTANGLKKVDLESKLRSWQQTPSNFSEETGPVDYKNAAPGKAWNTERVVPKKAELETFLSEISTDPSVQADFYVKNKEAIDKSLASNKVSGEGPTREFIANMIKDDARQRLSEVTIKKTPVDLPNPGDSGKSAYDPNSGNADFRWGKESFSSSMLRDDFVNQYVEDIRASIKAGTKSVEYPDGQDMSPEVAASTTKAANDLYNKLLGLDEFWTIKDQRFQSNAPENWNTPSGGIKGTLMGVGVTKPNENGYAFRKAYFMTPAGFVIEEPYKNVQSQIETYTRGRDKDTPDPGFNLDKARSSGKSTSENVIKGTSADLAEAAQKKGMSPDEYIKFAENHGYKFEIS